MKTFKINPLVLAMAVVLPSSVYAQDAQIDEVVVSGFRASLNASLDIKKAAVGAVDSIVAEDIGKFPDNNLAESMARLPGVNIDRTGGEGKTISVRGLSPQFSRVRINGMETIATGYGNKGRSFDFNIFASDLFSRIDVNKTMKADFEEGSLGATVDMYTAHPLDSTKDAFVVSYTQGYNDLSKASDPRITALASIQNEDGTLGAAVSVAKSQRSITQQGHNSGRWEANATGNNVWANAAALPAAVNAAVHPRFPRQMDRDIDLDRTGVTGSFQWKPTDDTKLSVDILDASLGFNQHDINLTPISLARTTTTGRKETSVNAYEIDSTKNAMVYAKLAGVDIRSENFTAETQTEFHQATVTLEHKFNDSFSMKALVGKSHSNTEATEDTAILEKFNAGMTYDYRVNAMDPAISFDFDLKDPNNWKVSELRDRPSYTNNSFETQSADFKWEINDTFSAETGASRKKFAFDILALTRDTAIINQTKTPQGSAVSPTQKGCTFNSIAVDSSMGAVFTPSNGQNPFFLGNSNSVFEKMNFFNDSVCYPLRINASDDRSVEEQDTGYYVQGNFNTEILDMPFKGNAGIRKASTDLTSVGVLAGLDAKVTRTYSDNLPSVNLSLSPIDTVTIRVSWAKVMSRPDLGNLTPGGSLDNFNRKYTAGNPFLNPFRAKATDISVDWYFMKEALVSIAYFKKDISSFPQKSITQLAFSDLGLSTNVSPAPATASDLYTVTSQSNGLGGYLDGYEAQFQTPFNFGPDWLHNFGIKLNYTKINSDLNVGTFVAPIHVKLPGQSDNSYNGTLWYENGDLQGRVSYTYRSGYITSSTSQSTAGAGYDTTDKVGVVDAAFSYQLNDHLKFSLDLINLNGASETTLNGDVDLIDTTLKFGRQAYLGASYTF
jgi:iron complex outermembrane receptor protein